MYTECPKCLSTVLPNSTSCDNCGIVFEKYQAPKHAFDDPVISDHSHKLPVHKVPFYKKPLSPFASFIIIALLIAIFAYSYYITFR